MINLDLRRATLIASTALVGTLATTAHAEAKHFSIPAQPASTAIGQLGHQGDVQIVAAHKLMENKRTNAVNGDLTVPEALSRLLRNTGLSAREQRPNTYAIVLADRGNDPAPDGLVRTAAVQPASSPAISAPIQDDPTGDAAPNAASEIVVTGLRASLNNARNIKRQSLGIVDAISTQDIGKLPDTNLAESLQRVSGVSIDRSGGEGAFITVRGFGPEFNTVLVNGRQLATPTDPSQASGRAFSFDTLASELVAGVEVYKSSTARLQSGGVGSTVNIKTAHPFDFRGSKLSATVDGNYDQNSKKGAPDASFLFSDTFADGKLGVLVSGSYQRRHDKLYQAQTDGWLVNPDVPAGEVNGGAGTVSASNPQGNLFIPQNLDTKVTIEDRERIGGTLVLQYRPVDDVTITADRLYTRFTDTTDARSYGHWFTASNLTDVKTDANGTAIDLTQATGIATDFHDKKFDKRTNTKEFGLNLDWKLDSNWALNLDGNYSKAKESPNGGKEAYLALLGYLTGSERYRSDGSTLPYGTETLPTFANPASPCGSAVTNSGVPATGNVVGAGEPLCQHVMLLRGYGVEDEVYQIRADLAYKSDEQEGLVSLNLGFYFSHDSKDTSLYSNDGNCGCTTCGYNLPVPPGVATSVFNGGGDFLSGVSGADRLLTQWQTFSGPDLFDAITAQQRATNPNFTFAPPLVNDTIVTERVLGGYLETEFGGHLLDRPFSVVTGVRFENTSTNINGLATAYTALVKLANDQTQYGSTSSGTQRTIGSTSYSNVLPSLTFKWQLDGQVHCALCGLADDDAADARAAFASHDAGNAAARQLRGEQRQPWPQAVQVEQSRSVVRILLRPVELRLAWCLLQERQQLHRAEPDDRHGDERDRQPAARPGDGHCRPSSPSPRPSTGQDRDGERGWRRHPAVLWDTGFGVQLNGTLVGSQSTSLNPQDLTNKFALTGLSNSANAVLFYDKHGIEARIAYNWRDHFLQYLAPPPLNGAGQAVTQVRPLSRWTRA